VSVLTPPVDMPVEPFDEVLASYARGILSPALHALVSSHLVISPQSRNYVAVMESAAASVLDDDNGQVEVPFRDEKLAAIFARAQDSDIRLPQQSISDDLSSKSHGLIPSPLRRFLGRELDDIPWKTLMPGVWHYKLDDYGKHSEHHPDDATHHLHDEATLYWIRAGKAMPSHTHEGSEVTLVLKGAFTDGSGYYGRGDVCVAGQETDHAPVADAKEDCICFAVTDGRLRLTGPFGRIIEKFRR
jgi:putative transcriptional regulator